jgi:hypothetical protein
MIEPKVIVLHALRDDSRSTTISHAACFGRHIVDYKVEYVNIFGELPKDSASDLVVVTYELVALRNLPIWNHLVERMQPFLKNSKLRVLMPQDDYSRSDVLDEFVVSQNFDFVYTPLTRELNKIYPRSISHGVKFHEAFTGYFDESNNEYLRGFTVPFRERSVDLGQRVRLLPPQFGEEAGRKGRLAIAFAQHAENIGFVCDVSTKPEDVFVGDAWWKFLGNSKFTVSRRGGASMADPTGRLADRVRRFKMRHPQASMDDLRNAISLRGGREGDFSAISPRLFEAAALGVCQILVPDDYVDGFEPWVHYIPISENLSNINEVFDVMRDSEQCLEIVKASQELLISSNAFTYGAFVKRFREETKLAFSSDRVYSMSDSSDAYNDVLVRGSECLSWVQDYVSRAYLGKNLKNAIESLKHGRLFICDEVDVQWSGHAAQHAESLALWLNAFLSKQLPIESFVIPWRTMSSLIAVQK